MPNGAYELKTRSNQGFGNSIMLSLFLGCRDNPLPWLLQYHPT